MEQQLFDVNSLKIAKPCNASWAGMSGDERARHCDACKKNVYNVAGMSREDVTNLICDNEGKVCLRLSRRADGTVITKDCPVGLAGLRKRISIAAMVWFMVLFGGLATAKGIEKGEESSREDVMNELRAKPVIGSVIDTFWPQATMGVTVGKIAVAPPTSPVSSTMGEVAFIEPTDGTTTGTPISP